MALLTEEQINDILDITNVCGSSIVVSELIEWNEKQTAQFEPNWDNAPEKATQAVVNSFWVDANGDTFGVYKTYYDRPKPIITPHPHATMMLKYAEVAARRVDPWVEFERFSHCDREWDGLPYHPDWTQGQTYRHIGDDK
jgi:hypothetical protein